MDPHLEEDTIFTLPTTAHQTQILTRVLDTPTAHQLATAMAVHSPIHSWREVTVFNRMKLKCSMKLLNRKGIQFGILPYALQYNNQPGVF